MLNYSVRPHPSDVGQMSEIMILRELIRNGYRVSIPFMGMNQRYDFIVDNGSNLLRAQCKTGKLTEGKIIFNGCSVDKKQSRRYTDEVEIFLVYCPDTDKVYWLPIEEITSDKPYLRVDPPKNGQTKGIRWAVQFELCPIGANG